MSFQVPALLEIRLAKITHPLKINYKELAFLFIHFYLFFILECYIMLYISLVFHVQKVEL